MRVLPFLILVTVVLGRTTLNLSELFAKTSLVAPQLNISFHNAEMENGILSFEDMEINGHDVRFPNRGLSKDKDSTRRARNDNSLDFDMGGAIEYDELVSSIDTNIDPCDDFYSFVCNGWKNATPIPYDKRETTQMQYLANKSEKELREFMENHAEAITKEQKQMHKYFNSCMATSGGQYSSHVFQLLLGKLRTERFGVNFLTDWLLVFYPLTIMYDVMVLPDEVNSTNNILAIQPVPTMQSFSTYFDPAYAAEFVAWRHSLYDFLSLLAKDDVNGDFFDMSESSKWRMVDSLLKVDQNMAKILDSGEFSTDSLVVFLDDLNAVLPSTDWQMYLDFLIPSEVKPHLERSEIIIYQIDQAKAYEELFAGLEPVVLRDYLDWKIIFKYASFLGDKYNSVLNNFSKQAYGVTESEITTKHCRQFTSTFFSDVLGQMWLKKYFDNSTIDKVGKIVVRVKDSFLTMLDHNAWMDEKTKERARHKAKSMVTIVGFDKLQMDEKNIAKKYQTLKLDDVDFFLDLHDRVEKWYNRDQFLKLMQPNDRNRFETTVTDPNAYYCPSLNQIAILAGLLQEPFFNSSWPDELNIAGLGMVIGHEITHGFDDMGSMYDELGNRANWWDRITYNSFSQKTECIEKQYDEIAVTEDAKINGKRTKGENIADNGGMRAAIRTIFDNTTSTFQIQGLEGYTPEQLFFMTYAYTWCSNIRPGILLSNLATDSHSPATARVNTVLSNQPEFAKAFKCAANTKMNPENKCTVW